MAPLSALGAGRCSILYGLTRGSGRLLLALLYAFATPIYRTATQPECADCELARSPGLALAAVDDPVAPPGAYLPAGWCGWTLVLTTAARSQSQP